jgi:hypothetical protein
MSDDVVDLGAMILPAMPDVEIQVQAQQDTGAITQVTLVSGNAGVQVQPFAAPRSGGMWDDVRGQIRASINQGGGLVEEVDGSFGREVNAQIKQENGMQPVRFVAIEGDRWLLRAVFLGTAARSGPDADKLEEYVRSITVVRGEDAMPAGGALPLRLPTQTAASDPGLPPLDPFERGPEITETR